MAPSELLVTVIDDGRFTEIEAEPDSPGARSAAVGGGHRPGGRAGERRSASRSTTGSGVRRVISRPRIGGPRSTTASGAGRALRAGAAQRDAARVRRPGGGGDPFRHVGRQDLTATVDLAAVRSARGQRRARARGRDHPGRAARGRGHGRPARRPSCAGPGPRSRTRSGFDRPWPVSSTRAPWAVSASWSSAEPAAASSWRASAGCAARLTHLADTPCRPASPASLRGAGRGPATDAAARMRGPGRAARAPTAIHRERCRQRPGGAVRHRGLCDPIWYVVGFAFAGVSFVFLTIGLAWLISHRVRGDQHKGYPYESGIDTYGDTHARFGHLLLHLCADVRCLRHRGRVHLPVGADLPRSVCLGPPPCSSACWCSSASCCSGSPTPGARGCSMAMTPDGPDDLPGPGRRAGRRSPGGGEAPAESLVAGDVGRP